jgi:hypothetical protein
MAAISSLTIRGGQDAVERLRRAAASRAHPRRAHAAPQQTEGVRARRRAPWLSGSVQEDPATRAGRPDAGRFRARWPASDERGDPRLPATSRAVRELKQNALPRPAAGALPLLLACLAALRSFAP